MFFANGIHVVQVGDCASDAQDSVMCSCREPHFVDTGFKQFPTRAFKRQKERICREFICPLCRVLLWVNRCA